MNEISVSEFSWPRVRPRRFSANRGGHAPGHLRDALLEALEETWRESRPWWEALAIEFFDSSKQIWWDQTTACERGAWLLGQLWNCTDIVSGHFWVPVDLPRGRTFARLVRALKAELMEMEDSPESRGR
jgi:hypothetical protein